MNLVLEVVGQNAPGPSAERRKVFGVGGGSIGRAPECDWVLSSPYISRHHATVCCINGVFYIESTGENGVAVNTPESILPQLERRAVQSGDRLFIDEYEISVSVSGVEAQDSSSKLDLFDAGGGEDPFGIGDSAPARASFESIARGSGDGAVSDEIEGIGSDNLDPLKNLTAPQSSGTKPRDEPSWNHSSSLADHFTPPPVVSVAAPIPRSALPIGEDWDQTQFTSAATRVEPVPEETLDVTASEPAEELALLRTAPRVSTPAVSPVVSAPVNSPPAKVAPPLLGDDAAMNAIVHRMVQGLIDVLRARGEFRNQFRLPVTRVRTAENNPLKFAINAEDALDSLMGRRHPGFMAADEAFEDAFDDILFHQVAMIAGMRAGFDCVMNRFDPQKLQERFDRQLKHTGFLSVASKLRYWDLYADFFEELSGDADGAFQRLFGEEFASAYEKQLTNLKRDRGNPRH